MAKATKSKATQANKPQTGEKFLSAKDLAKMANVKPTVLRCCLRAHFTGRISTIKGGNGLKTYQVKANDPIVKEALAKLKGNGDKGKATKPAKAVKVQADKGAGEEPAPKSLLCNPLCKFYAEDGICTKRNQQAEEGLSCDFYEPREPESQFNYKGYQFTLHKDLTVTVINPDNSISHHNCLANALYQRGFSFKQLEKEGALPKELAGVK